MNNTGLNSSINEAVLPQLYYARRRLYSYKPLLGWLYPLDRTYQKSRKVSTRTVKSLGVLLNIERFSDRIAVNEDRMSKKFQSPRKQRDNLINSFNTKNCRIVVSRSEFFHYNLAECVKKW